MLLDRVNSDRIHEIQQFLDQMGGKSFDAAAASVQDAVLPWLRAKLAMANEQQCLLGSLAAAHHAGIPLNYAAVEQLANTLHTIHAHTRWFEENHVKNSALFGQVYSGISTDWESLRSGLLYAKEILALFDHQSLPEETIELACRGMNGEQQMQFGMLLHIDLTQMKQELASALGPVSDMSALTGIALRMKFLLEAAITLHHVAEQIAVYRQDGEMDADHIAQELPLIVEIVQMRDEAVKKHAQYASAFGERYQGDATDWHQVIADLEHLDAFLSKDRKAVQAEHLRCLCTPAQDESADTGANRCELVGICRQMQQLMEQAGPKLQSFADEFEEQALNAASTTLTAIAERYRACMDHFDALSHWLEYIETRNACQDAGLASFTDAIISRDNAIPDVLSAFERAFYTQWISSHMDDIPAVQTFKKNMFESKIAEFAKLDVAQYETAQHRIRQSIISTFPPLDETAPKGSELAILKHEMEKRARFMPLRKLFRQIPSLLLNLKPCLMMSPLSVAYFLSADQYHFDMVIFDEASQIFPQDAVGAMFRADQVIIAGDTRQMPPTNFFGANAGGSTDYDDENEEMEELGESILEECEVKLPARTLQWHYRSQHEHLIAFSNREIYGNHLVTFPSSNERMKDTGVEFVYVKDGYYESAPRNCNRVEAERIVELIRQHIETHPERSLGVIAFSEKQQQAITAAVQRFREQHNDPRYEQFFAEDKEDEFFIKNLENVQGDERDTILFSVGYARTKKQIADGKPMSMRFGPLGLAGGERRLNVAITRAKINVKLVSSIQPSDIDLTRTKSEGVRMLRSYLEFAMHGTSALAQSGHDHDHDDFANTVAEFIRAHGHQVVQHVGLSGYQIDLAVKHPSELADLYAVGIECDGNAYASARTARDRERLRKSVLTHMGWNLYRVWSTAWFSDPKHEGERLMAYIQKAIADADDKVREIEAEKRRMESMKAQDAREEQIRLERECKERSAQEQRKQEAKAAEMRHLERQRQRVIEARQRTSVLLAKQQDFRQMSFADMQNSPISAGHISTSAQQGYAVPVDDLAWAVVGAAVALRDGSVGRIASIDSPYLAVSVDGQIKKFKYPNAFTDGFLTRADLDNSNGNEKTAVSENANAQKAQPRQEGRGLEELCYELGQNGFRYIHDKSLSELTWVYYNRAQETLFENIVRSYAVKWRLEKRGCRATGFKPAWCISQ